MAFDAEIIGTWDVCRSTIRWVLDMVLSKKIDIGPFVETRPMSRIASVFRRGFTRPARRRNESF